MYKVKTVIERYCPHLEKNVVVEINYDPETGSSEKCLSCQNCENIDGKCAQIRA